MIGRRRGHQKWLPKWLPKIREAPLANENARLLE